jgi:hypothetical protein
MIPLIVYGSRPIDVSIGRLSEKMLDGTRTLTLQRHFYSS